MPTTIRVHDGTADELHDLKERSESYNDVVEYLLEVDREHGPRRADSG
jgi:predicted CopG family antitoxin